MKGLKFSLIVAAIALGAQLLLYAAYYSTERFDLPGDRVIADVVGFIYAPPIGYVGGYVHDAGWAVVG
jgi:hypothetical protein